ncbi:SET domain-containing protein 5 [Beauveria bassiana]|uniref:SET domain-containing protein 5 n=1 Tax=Beauveria bassiana TaxID=176275 RepID=A0A2N6NHN1_BEABA|nr:SET domain-containing protein 5 [Beauveria bassiana]
MDGTRLVGNRCREIWEIIYDRFNKFLANCVCGKVGGVSGKALFALLSRINHSCVPNTHWVFNTAIERLTVHAIRHIRAGEQITISYIQDPLAAKQVRDSMFCAMEFLMQLRCVYRPGHEGSHLGAYKS